MLCWLSILCISQCTYNVDVQRNTYKLYNFDLKKGEDLCINSSSTLFYLYFHEVNFENQVSFYRKFTTNGIQEIEYNSSFSSLARIHRSIPNASSYKILANSPGKISFSVIGTEECEKYIHVTNAHTGQINGKLAKNFTRCYIIADPSPYSIKLSTKMDSNDQFCYNDSENHTTCKSNITSWNRYYLANSNPTLIKVQFYEIIGKHFILELASDQQANPEELFFGNSRAITTPLPEPTPIYVEVDGLSTWALVFLIISISLLLVVVLIYGIRNKFWSCIKNKNVAEGVPSHQPRMPSDFIKTPN